jgi:hypothetical protein
MKFLTVKFYPSSPLLTFTMVQEFSSALFLYHKFAKEVLNEEEHKNKSL